MNELLLALSAGSDAATVAIGVILLKHHTRLERIETLTLVMARKLRVDASIIKKDA